MPRRPLVALCLVAIAAACTGPAAPPASPDAPGASPGPSGSGATGGGGTLVLAIDSDPGHLNPAITTSGATHTASELIYNGLVELGEDLEPLPELAESWQIEEDGAVYRFTLRNGVTWHDGEPFTSADVKFSFEEVLLEFHARTRASVGPVLDSIETPDDLTVVFNFTEPYAPLLGQLDVTEAPIVAQHIYEGSDPQENPANIDPVGTGPFRFVSYAPDSEVRLERNPDYWKPGLPKLDEVVMRVNPEKGSQVIALEAGDVQWLWGVPGPDQPRLDEDPNIEFLRTDRNPGGSNCIMTMSFNLERPMFADLNVRKAIAHALDRDAFLERVLFGEGRVAEAPISSGIGWAHAADLPMPGFDMAEAERLLDEAGWTRDGEGTRTAQGVEGVEDGTPLAFDFVHFPSFARYGELLRTQLQQVGAEVELRPLEPPVFAPTVFTERDFDTNIISYCNGTDPEIGVRRMFDSAQIGAVPFSNAAAYENAEVDRLFSEAASTVDQAQRAELYREIQEIVVEEQPYVWIVETSGTRAFRTTCSGFKAYGLFAEEATCSQ